MIIRCFLTEIRQPIVILFLTLLNLDHSVLETTVVHGGQMAERLGIGLLIRRVPVRFPAVPNDVASLGKALHLLASGECPCTYCKSLCIRVSAK